MKSRLLKEEMRHILRSNKDIMNHPEWWGDKDDEFYAPFVNTLVELGIYPWTWGQSKGDTTFRSIYCSFIYTYLTKGLKIKNNIAGLFISTDDNEVSDNVKLVLERDNIKIYMYKGLVEGQLSFEAYCDTEDTQSIKKVTSLLAEFLTEYYDANFLVIGARKLNRDEELSDFHVLVSILKSYWDYAENGCTHMYHLKKRKDGEKINAKDMFEKFEISSESLEHQKKGYKEIHDIILSKSGKTTLGKILHKFSLIHSLTTPHE